MSLRRMSRRHPRPINSSPGRVFAPKFRPSKIDHRDRGIHTHIEREETSTASRLFYLGWTSGEHQLKWKSYDCNTWCYDYHVGYFSTSIMKLGSSNWVHKTQVHLSKQGTTLVPKLPKPLNLWSGSTPFILPDPVTLIRIEALFVLYKHVH